MTEINEQIDLETERVTSTIKLHIFRHGAKLVAKGMPDHETPLSDFGREQAREKSTSKDISQSIAFGNPRIRTQETASLVMGGELNSINGSETLSDLRTKIDNGLNVGSKIRVDERLDIHDPDTDEYDDQFFEAAKSSRYLEFLFKESDMAAEKFGDKKADTYSRMASQVALIIQKYLNIAPRWDKLANDDKKRYQNTLERFFSTHGGIGESFLGKVIELTKGIKERDRFAEALKMQGFDFLEGFDIEIMNYGGQDSEIRIVFQKDYAENTVFNFNEKISPIILQKILGS